MKPRMSIVSQLGVGYLADDSFHLPGLTEEAEHAEDASVAHRVLVSPGAHVLLLVLVPVHIVGRLLTHVAVY